MEVAFLGLGNMGSGMANCLLKAGHTVRVWNRTAEKMALLVKAGAVACESAVDAAKNVPVVFSCLMDDKSIQNVFGGPALSEIDQRFSDGVIAHMAPAAIHVCVTTISPQCADWLAERHAANGSRYVSGPVLGRPDAAAAGTLLQFLAGDASAVEEVQPVCKAFANTFVPLAGPARVANSQKLCANFFIVSLVEVFAECYTFAEKTGASKEVMAQFFERAFAHPGLQGYARRMKDRVTDGKGGFSMRGGLKDVRLMLDAARNAGCPLEIAELVQGKMSVAMERGLADADWSAIQQVTRTRAGLDA
jgi:3-hydroxyisobutyrate dehydrogenase-like beta-hydroxyacid dehydrogenase